MIRRRKKRHHARRKARAASPAKRRRRRRHVRSNPTVPVLFANPRRRKRRRKAHRASGPRRRRRNRLSRIRGPVFIKRRSNPGRMSMGSLGALVRIGVVGSLGIATARIGMALYSKHMAATVVGGDTDPKSMRNILNEALRLAAGAALTLLVEKMVIRRIGRHTDSLAFKVAGLAECGRQGVGVVVKRLSPDTDLAPYGLNGYGMSNAYALGELEPIDSFQGLEEASSFEGIDTADQFAYDSHPFQIAQ